jgi:hypothetical protein
MRALARLLIRHAAGRPGSASGKCDLLAIHAGNAGSLPDINASRTLEINSGMQQIHGK